MHYNLASFLLSVLFWTRAASQSACRNFDSYCKNNYLYIINNNLHNIQYSQRVSVLDRESVIAGIYFSQTSVIYFCWGLSCCPYYRGVCNSEVSARRELTVYTCTSN